MVFSKGIRESLPQSSRIIPHGDIPWLSADENQPISYESVFYRDEEYSVKEFVDDL